MPSAGSASHRPLAGAGSINLGRAISESLLSSLAPRGQPQAIARPRLPMSKVTDPSAPRDSGLFARRTRGDDHASSPAMINHLGTWRAVVADHWGRAVVANHRGRAVVANHPGRLRSCACASWLAEGLARRADRSGGQRRDDRECNVHAHWFCSFDQRSGLLRVRKKWRSAGSVASIDRLTRAALEEP
jgi:hypothetical protein